MLKIRGLQKTTLLDFPGKVAATVFLGGCNMRCPFCHNMNLVCSDDLPELAEEDILKFLSSRTGILDGVCITGGEPTLYKDLPQFLRSVKELGFSVKLDTNGTDPDMISLLSKEHLIDYTAMDIKSSFSNYGRACGISDIDMEPIKKSIELLIGGACDYEFRTTAVYEFLDDTAVSDIAQAIKGARRYFLQGYVESEFVPDKSLRAIPKEKLLQYVQELSKFIDHVDIRGL